MEQKEVSEGKKIKYAQNYGINSFCTKYNQAIKDIAVWGKDTLLQNHKKEQMKSIVLPALARSNREYQMR